MFECVPVITTPSGGKTFSLYPLKDLQAVKIIHSVLCFDMVLVNNNKRKQSKLQVNNGKLLDGESSQWVNKLVTVKTVSQQVPKYLSQQWEKASEKGEVGKISIEKYVVKIVNVTDFLHGFMFLNLSFINVLMFFAPSDRKQGRPEVRQLLLIYH